MLWILSDRIENDVGDFQNMKGQQLCETVNYRQRLITARTYQVTHTNDKLIVQMLHIFISIILVEINMLPIRLTLLYF